MLLLVASWRNWDVDQLLSALVVPRWRIEDAKGWRHAWVEDMNRQ